MVGAIQDRASIEVLRGCVRGCRFCQAGFLYRPKMCIRDRADLGCGTGELTLMLTQSGYDMIGIDQSEEMLCVVRDKAEQLSLIHI